MARPAKWLGILDASREEALNAVEFFNRPAGRRSLEAFLVHMHIAWLYLLQAQFVRSGMNFYERDPQHPRRYARIDGEKKAWGLQKCVRQRWPEPNHPVRKNLELTISLRNRIEHRYESGLRTMSAGFAQALVLNFEEELTSKFGAKWTIAGVVHMPVALSTYTREGVAAMRKAQLAVPDHLQSFFLDFRNQLGDDVLDDRRFEFRIEIVQRRAPATEADLAVSFVREEDLTPDELEAYEQLERTGRIIVRDKERPVSNLGWMKPTAVSQRVEARIPFRFRASSEFPAAWRRLGVRPAANAVGKDRAKTKEQYCVYDEPHDDYVYTSAYVDRLVECCQTVEGFRNLIGRDPKPKQVQQNS